VSSTPSAHGPGALTIIPVPGIGEVEAGDELAVLIADAAERAGTPVLPRDCVVVTQKVVSKAEGRIVPLPHDDLDARRALVESESVRILRRRGDLVISETSHGFVCANAGVDLSNVRDGYAALLPVEPDRSAKHIRDAFRARAGVNVGVIVSDTFGRAWRRGLTDVAIGVSGIAAVVDLRDTPDALGRVLHVTEVAVADEIASAAELVMGKAAGVPAAIVRGLDTSWFRDGSSRELVRPPSEDLFR
jgi:coenzyme F420-0:L-glutamate ligase/coenzyme F420-1:gamma-L-glutamate ligase